MARLPGIPPNRAGLLARFAYRFSKRMIGKVSEPLTWRRTTRGSSVAT